jgi:sterol desaturase/sphingolipid hydroxylase (fatty acid hydroxylase superfamily)
VRLLFADIFKAWDRLATTYFKTLPRMLDRTRAWRNRYMDAVK